MKCNEPYPEGSYEPLSPENRAALAELIGDAARPAPADFLLRLGHTVKDCRTHDHGTGEDIFCGNLAGWMGERMALVMRRLVDAEAELERRPDRAEVLREGADAVDSGKLRFPEDVRNGASWAARMLRRMAAPDGEDTPTGGESTRDAGPVARSVQCGDCGAYGDVNHADDGLLYLFPSGQIGHPRTAEGGATRG